MAFSEKQPEQGDQPRKTRPARSLTGRSVRNARRPLLRPALLCARHEERPKNFRERGSHPAGRGVGENNRPASASHGGRALRRIACGSVSASGPVESRRAGATLSGRARRCARSKHGRRAKRAFAFEFRARGHHAPALGPCGRRGRARLPGGPTGASPQPGEIPGPPDPARGSRYEERGAIRGRCGGGGRRTDYPGKGARPHRPAPHRGGGIRRQKPRTA